MYTEGQKLWLVPNRFSRNGDPHEVEITKVGRKWLTLDNGYRAAVDGLFLDGGKYSSPGVCYLSREAWEIEKALDDAWSKLRMDVYLARSVPDGLTVRCIHDARKLLGL